MTHDRCGRLIGLIFALTAFTGAGLVQAGTPEVLTEESPPFNYTDQGKLTGAATEVVQAWQQALNAMHTDGTFNRIVQHSKGEAP